MKVRILFVGYIILMLVLMILAHEMNHYTTMKYFDPCVEPKITPGILMFTTSVERDFSETEAFAHSMIDKDHYTLLQIVCFGVIVFSAFNMFRKNE